MLCSLDLFFDIFLLWLISRIYNIEMVRVQAPGTEIFRASNHIAVKLNIASIRKYVELVIFPSIKVC